MSQVGRGARWPSPHGRSDPSSTFFAAATSFAASSVSRRGGRCDRPRTCDVASRRARRGRRYPDARILRRRSSRRRPRSQGAACRVGEGDAIGRALAMSQVGRGARWPSPPGRSDPSSTFFAAATSFAGSSVSRRRGRCDRPRTCDVASRSWCTLAVATRTLGSFVDLLRGGDVVRGEQRDVVVGEEDAIGRGSSRVSAAAVPSCSPFTRPCPSATAHLRCRK